ncbi:hypothetical protein D3C76_1468130 [compost metagenome]
MLSPHLGFNSGQQFTCTKRFGHIVISTKLQAKYLINLSVLGCKHNDRNVQVRRTHLAADVHAIFAGQHKIKQHKIGPFGQCQLHCTVAIKSTNNLVAFFF